jgi:hypothetical protein
MVLPLLSIAQMRLEINLGKRNNLVEEAGIGVGGRFDSWWNHASME